MGKLTRILNILVNLFLNVPPKTTLLHFSFVCLFDFRERERNLDDTVRVTCNILLCTKNHCHSQRLTAKSGPPRQKRTRLKSYGADRVKPLEYSTCEHAWKQMEDQRSRNGGSMPVQIAVKSSICWTTGHADRQTGALRQGVPQIPHRGITESATFRETKMSCGTSTREGS